MGSTFNYGVGKVAAALLPLLTAGLAACAPTSDSLGDNKASRASAERSAKSVAARNSYSPHILTDPYVLKQQRAAAEALRRSCEQDNEHCDLAADADRYLDEQDARR